MTPWLLVLLSSLMLTANLCAQTVEIDESLDRSGESVKLLATDLDAGFMIQTYREGPEKAVVEAQCRTIRSDWNQRWIGGPSSVRWTTPCQVVIHRSQQSYLAAVGRWGGSTSGSSLVRREPDGSTTRRIDLLPTPNGECTSLAHELVHVMLADHFPAGTPLWIDEGLALLCDTPQKQSMHWRDCAIAMQSGTMLPLQRLMELDRPTSPAQFAAVYGQSLTLTRFLATKEDPVKILEFVRHARKSGHLDAMQTIYGIRGWEELEREWRAYVNSHAEVSRFRRRAT